MFVRFTVMLSLVLSAALACSQQTSNTPADTSVTLSPIIVTPNEAKERLTPATFSTIPQKQLQQHYSVFDVPVYLSELPSTTWYSENGNGIGYNYINLRGFDQRRLSVMVNGIPQNDPEDQNVYWIDFPDILGSTENIQVQRGAGSAFYGPAAIGGSINLITNPYTDKPGVSFESTFGFQEFSDSSKSFPLNTKKYSATITSGLIDNTYVLYGRLGNISSDGYRSNSWTNLNSYFLGAVRMDPNMVTRINIYGGPLTDGLSYTGLPSFVNTNPALRRQNLAYWDLDSTGKQYADFGVRRPQESESYTQPHYELLNDWNLSPNLLLSNTIFYLHGEGYYDYDASWADTSMLRIGYLYGIPTDQNPQNTLVRAFVGNDQIGWLPHLLIKGERNDLTLGAELRFHRSDHWGSIDYGSGLPASLNPDYHFYEYNGKKDILSAYVHDVYKLSGKADVEADLQATHMEYGISNDKYTGYDFTYGYFFLNPRLGINENWDQHWNSYFSMAYTSREPVLNDLYPGEESYYGETPQFKADTVNGQIVYDYNSPYAQPEHLFDFELGTICRRGSTMLSANVYWMEFIDELVENGQLNIFGQPVTSNAGRSRHIGLEVEAAAPLNSEFSLGGNFSTSVNKLIHYSVNVNGEIVSYDGNPIAGFPDALGNLRLTYTHDALSVSWAGQYVGPFYTDNSQSESLKVDAHFVGNGEIVYHTPQILGINFIVRGEVMNMFDALYFAAGDGSEFFPAAERNFVVGIVTNL